MKYTYFSSPYKLNIKLKNISSYNDSIPIRKNNIKSYDTIINSIPMLTNKFCYIKNRIAIHNKILNKIPLIHNYSTITECKESEFPSNKFKSPIKLNNGYNNNLTINNINHRKNKSDMDFYFNQFRFEKKLENMNKKLRKKDFIIKNMQNIIDDTLNRLNKTNKENFLLHSEIIKLKYKTKFNNKNRDKNKNNIIDYRRNNIKINKINNINNINENNKNNFAKEIAKLNNRLDNILDRNNFKKGNKIIIKDKN